MSLLLSLALAAPTVPIQGALVDAAGAPVVGTQEVTFRLYSSVGDSSPDYSVTLPVLFQDGAFAAVLSPNPSDLPALLAFDDLRITVAVGGGAESERVPVGWTARAAYSSVCAT